MQAFGSLITILVGYYAYQWGSGHKKQPHPVIFFPVMALALIVTIPAYYIGKNHKAGKSWLGKQRVSNVAK